MSSQTVSALSKETLQEWVDGSPFMKYCQMTIVSVDAERGAVHMKMPLLDNLLRGGPQRQFHGGPIASLIDSAGDFAVAVVAKGTVPTINFRVDYLRPAGGSHLIAKATARRVGRTIGVADVDVYDDQDRLVAIGRGSYGSQPG